MDIYAIRKNKCAGVYTKKEVFEYIKDREQKCSIRIFTKGEELEAMRWAGVDSVDSAPSTLKADEEFAKLLNASLQEEKDYNKKKISSCNNPPNEFGGLHRMKGLSSDSGYSDKKKQIPPKETPTYNDKMPFLEKVIDDCKGKYNTLIIKTKSFGNLCYLTNSWYYEKHWDVEYAYSLDELIKYGFIEFKSKSSIKNNNGFYTFKNAYRLLDKDNVLTDYEKVIYLNHDEIRAVVPSNDMGMEWLVDGEYKEFESGNNKIKIIEDYYNNS